MSEAVLDGNIIEHMQKMIKMKEAKDSYFRRVSPTVKALLKEIPKGELVHLPKNCELHYYSCSGCCSFKEAILHYPLSFHPPVAGSEFTIRINVNYSDGDDGGREYCKEVSFSIPVDLELNFTTAKWNAWISTDLDLYKEKRQKELEEEIKTRKQELSKLWN